MNYILSQNTTIDQDGYHKLTFHEPFPPQDNLAMSPCHHLGFPLQGQVKFIHHQQDIVNFPHILLLSSVYYDSGGLCVPPLATWQSRIPLEHTQNVMRHQTRIFSIGQSPLTRPHNISCSPKRVCHPFHGFFKPIIDFFLSCTGTKSYVPLRQRGLECTPQRRKLSKLLDQSRLTS